MDTKSINKKRKTNKKSIYRNRIENTDFKMIIKKRVNKEEQKNYLARSLHIVIILNCSRPKFRLDC